MCALRELFLPRFVGEDKLPELEIPKHDPVIVTSCHSLGRLSEQPPRLGFTQPPARPYVGVQVAMVTFQQEIAPTTRCLHYAYRVARRACALQTKVGPQQCLATLVTLCQRLYKYKIEVSEKMTLVQIELLKNLEDIE